MWRDKTELVESPNVHMLLTHGAIGDMISSLPAVVFARKSHSPVLTIHLWVARYQVELVRHLIGQKGLEVHALDKFNETKSKWPGPGVMNGLKTPIVTRNRHNMVDYAYAVMLDTQPDADWMRCYPHWAPLGPRQIEDAYVVFPTGATNAPSVFKPALLRRLVDWADENGYKPVLVGKSSTEVTMMKADKPHKLTITDEANSMPPDTLAKCLDLRDKTTLLELRDICGHASAVVGIDGGTLHLAGTTDVPIVYGCTRVDPKHRPIVRHNERNWNLVHVTPRELDCAGCQSHWSLMFNHDFSTCLYGDAACTDRLHADDFIEALKQLGL